MSASDIFLMASLLLVGAGGTAVVLVRRLRVQAIVLSLFGLIQTLVFLALKAPDLALAQLAVGSAAVPVLFVLVINRISGATEE